MLNDVKRNRSQAPLVDTRTKLEYIVVAGDVIAKWHPVTPTERETDDPIFLQRCPPEEGEEIWLKDHGVAVLCRNISPHQDRREHLKDTTLMSTIAP